MASQLGGEDDEITGINVTPLVDVMLVLLVIFMVTTTYIVNKGIEVKLPQAATANDTIQTKNLAFILDKEEKLYLDGKPLDWEAVLEKIQASKTGDQGASIQALISADEKTPHGSVIRLIDLIRKGGITDFAINVELPPAEKASGPGAKPR